ncbi:NAD-dependent epimerase/dehydratase family protein [Rubrivirga sp.]|uniref:NAD-dependent epimerase/dehydratase family protein n=1 Tax=Rubrivirga sp. TaxID=1885344 RepID=UPI003B52DB48
MRTALLLGASGLVGGHLLRHLAADGRWARVVTLGRRPLATAGPTHEDHVVDFDRLAEQAALFACDDLFCALGTTIKQAGSRAAFRRVDLELPFEAAQLAHSAGATQTLLVSALGADPDSRVFYNRTKGEAERAVASVGFEAVQIARPSLLAGDRAEVRWGERVALAVLSPLAPVLRGPLAALRPTEADDVARALVAVAAARPAGTHVYPPEAIREWARSGGAEA